MKKKIIEEDFQNIFKMFGLSTDNEGRIVAFDVPLKVSGKYFKVPLEENISEGIDEEKYFWFIPFRDKVGEVKSPTIDMLLAVANVTINTALTKLLLAYIVFRTNKDDENSYQTAMRFDKRIFDNRIVKFTKGSSKIPLKLISMEGGGIFNLSVKADVFYGNKTYLKGCLFYSILDINPKIIGTLGLTKTDEAIATSFVEGIPSLLKLDPDDKNVIMASSNANSPAFVSLTNAYSYVLKELAKMAENIPHDDEFLSGLTDMANVDVSSFLDAMSDHALKLNKLSSGGGPDNFMSRIQNSLTNINKGGSALTISERPAVERTDYRDYRNDTAPRVTNENVVTNRYRAQQGNTSILDLVKEHMCSDPRGGQVGPYGSTRNRGGGGRRPI